MANFTNATHPPGKDKSCETGHVYVLALSLIDSFPLLVGQPAIARLLWVTLTSKKTIDTLNCNLAVFHNLQYLISIVHLCVLHLLPHVHHKILTFLLVYAQIGGPMSLSLICVERYAAVVYPTSYPLLKRYRLREAGSLAVWTLSVPTALLSVFTAKALSSIRDGLLDVLPFMWLLFMTALIVHCSVRITRTLRRSGPGAEKLHSAKKRAFKTVCGTSAIVVMCYAPLTLMQRLKFQDECVFDSIIRPVSLLLLSAAGVVHPLFYLLTQQKITCFQRGRK